MADTELQKQMNDLKNDLKALQTDVSDLAKMLKELGVGKVHDAASSMEEELEKAREEVKRRFGEARASGKHKMDDLEGDIGQHPFTSVLTAFGIGFIIAKMLDTGGRR